MVKNNLFFEKTPILAIKSYVKRMNDELESGDIGYYHLPELGSEILNAIKDIEPKGIT